MTIVTNDSRFFIALKKETCMGVEFKDNSKAVLSAMDLAKGKALTAVGMRGVEEVLNYMQHNYGRPIRQTGNLMRDVNYKLIPGEDKVAIGNSLEYAPWVHNGIARMKPRPYLRDAITENSDMWGEIAEEYLGKAFSEVNIDTTKTDLN